MHAIPSSLVIVNGGCTLDGGSIRLEMEGPTQLKHTLHLPQHVMPRNFRPGCPPGALIFDGEVLPVRGPEEATLLRALRNATYSLVGTPPGHEREHIGPPGRRGVLGEDLKSFTAAIDEGPTAAARWLVQGIIAFVESPAFVEVARQHGRVP